MSDEVKLLPCDVRVVELPLAEGEGAWFYFTRAIEATRPTDMEVRDAE